MSSKSTRTKSNNSKKPVKKNRMKQTIDQHNCNLDTGSDSDEPTFDRKDSRLYLNQVTELITNYDSDRDTRIAHDSDSEDDSGNEATEVNQTWGGYDSDTRR